MNKAASKWLYGRPRLGTAVGGGITPTLACDLRVVAADAQIGFVFARRGIVPEAASSYCGPARRGRLSALSLLHSNSLFAFWRFCMGGQGAQQPRKHGGGRSGQSCRSSSA
jgi:hypothetical protein